MRIELMSIGKMYQIFKTPGDRLSYALGLNRTPIWPCRPTEFWALRDASLSVRAGECVGVIGRNGAGKSTLLKIAAGIVSPSSGCVRVQRPFRALLELGVGFHPELTGRENIRAVLAYREERSRASERELEGDIIKFSELHDTIDQQLKTYSSGMFTRLAFATATAISPDVLIIDEILSTGDAYFVGKCHERIKQLSNESGAAVLMSSHDLGAIQALCQRAIWIDHGLVKLEGPTLDVLRAYGRSIRHEEEARLRALDARAAVVSSESNEAYGLGGIVITQVQLSTMHAKDVKSLYCEESFQVVIEWEAERTIKDPVFVFCIYLTSGSCAAQWMTSTSDLGYQEIFGNGRIVFSSERLLLGPGHYVASVGIFSKKPSRSIEPPAYHVLDRTVHFQVLDSEPGEAIERGICRQPVVADLQCINGK